MAELTRILAVIVILVTLVDAIEYCKMKSCNGKSHTMCKFSTMKPGPVCGRQVSTKLTKLEISEILKAHNTFRARVASGRETRGKPGPQPAGRIPPLKWDNELATIAQRWAMQCHYKTHDVCRNTARSKVGQNMAMKAFTGGWTTTMTELVRGWYDEVKHYSANDVKSFRFAPETAHYTQLIWSETTHVGCGLAKFKDGKFYRSFLVCNYSPTGNRYFNGKGLPLYPKINYKKTPTNVSPKAKHI